MEIYSLCSLIHAYSVCFSLWYVEYASNLERNAIKDVVLKYILNIYAVVFCQCI